MEHFNLPVFREKIHKEKRLTMDGYLKFVLNNLKYTINIPAARKLKENNLLTGRKFVLK
ncbi:MAG: hypothetical protein JW994_07745 [Candidatus Omnitrophica bacterium]|nr:hypothetical protein [Candidatus Omnitrophota bacterium]